MNSLSDVLLPWLADYFLLATLLLCTVLLVCWQIKQPARRLAICRPAILALLLLAGLCSLPGWSVIHLLTAESGKPDVQITSEVESPLPTEPSTFPATPYEMEFSFPAESIQENVALENPASQNSPAEPLPWTTWLVGIYLCGCLFMLLWQACGNAIARRMIAQASTAPQELQILLANIAQEHQAPKILVSERVQAPAALGLRQPIVLLPQHLINHDNNLLLPILAHEWAHIQNGDLRTLAIVRLLAILLWPHPLFLLLRRQVRLDQESLADATASELTTRADYAEQLVALARQSQHVRVPRLAASVGLWESASQLRRRVSLLLDDKLTILRSCSRRWRIGSAIGLLTIAAGLSLITLTPAEPLLAENETPEGPKEDIPQTDFIAATPIAESNKETQSPNGTLILQSSPADLADQKTASITAEKPAADASISDEEIGKLMRPHYKRLYDAMQPNTILGICLDEKGRPLEGVTVDVFIKKVRNQKQETKPILSTTSNAKGEFRFDDVIDIAKEYPEGIPSLQFPSRNRKILALIGRTTGRVPGFQNGFASSVAAQGEVKVWVMRPAQTLRGKITDLQGQPIEGAVVKAGMFAAIGGSYNINTATTDASGNYTIDDLAPRNAELERRRRAEQLKNNSDLALRHSSADLNGTLLVTHPKFASKRATVDDIPGQVDVQLVQGSSITGRVRLPDETIDIKSLAGSIIHLQRVVPPPKIEKSQDFVSFSQHQVEKTTLDESGHYRFSSLPAGTYHLNADVDGWVTLGVEDVVVAKGETVTAPEIRLTKGGLVRVQLVDDETGQPMQFEKPTAGYLSPQA